MTRQPPQPLFPKPSPKQVCALDTLRYCHLLISIDSSERKDEPESPPPVPTRAPTSMPVPAGPRRAAPPRKKSSKNAPATALPEPPIEEAEGVAVQSPPITDEPADRAVHDESLATRDSQKETGEVAEAIEATYDQHLDITADAEQRQTPPPASTETFHEHVEEAEKQEAEEELVERAGSHAEEKSMHTAADDQEVSSEQPPDTVEVEEEEEEEEEARRQRVAAKLAQMGAFNPLAGPPPIPQRGSFDEPALAPSEGPFDVEDEVNVDTEEHGETIPSPPAVPARHDAVQSFEHDAEPTDQDNAKVDRVTAHRDGES